MTITAPSPVVANTTGTVGLTFSGLAPATRYIGSAAYHDGAFFLTSTAVTIVSVTTP